MLHKHQPDPILDLCKATQSKSENLPVRRSFSLKRDSAPISQSLSATVATSRERMGSRGTKEVSRETRSRYERLGDNVSCKSENSDNEGSLLRNHNFTMSVRHPPKRWRNCIAITIPHVPPVKLNKAFEEEPEFCQDRFSRDVSPTSRVSDILLDPIPLDQTASTHVHLLDSPESPRSELSTCKSGKKQKLLFSCRRSPSCEGSWKVDLARISAERHPRHVESPSRRFGDYDSLFDENGGLPPNKTMRSKNGGFYFYREYPELMELPGWRSNCSALDTGKRRRDDLVIRNSAVNRSHLADSHPPTLAYNTHNDLLVNRNSDGKTFCLLIRADLVCEMKEVAGFGVF